MRDRKVHYKTTTNEAAREDEARWSLKACGFPSPFLLGVWGALELPCGYFSNLMFHALHVCMIR